MKQLLKVLLMIPCLVFLVNCSKSSKDSNKNNNQCNSNYNTGYNDPYNQGYNNNYNNCNYGGSGGSGGYSNSQQRCQGLYWYQGQPVICQTSMDCAGWQLQVNSTGPNAQTPGRAGRTVLCIP